MLTSVLFQILSLEPLLSLPPSSHTYIVNKIQDTFKVEPLIKDTLNKGHLCIKDTFQYTV